MKEARIRERFRFSTGPYSDRVAVLATKHGKERAVARPLRAALGLIVTVRDEIDTDLLGTFTGEVERVGTPREVAINKARLGMRASGIPLGLASEGSFGPHPLIPFLIASDHEILAFVDDDLGITVVEGILTEETNFGHCRARTLSDLATFMKQAQFPSHALIVRPNDGIKPGVLFKGIADLGTLEDAVIRCAAASPDGVAYVETDMRAHLNPTRQKAIRRVAFRLARRLASSCPSCGVPGWGRTGGERGLPCQACGTPTELLKHEIFGCPRCAHTDVKPRSDGRQYAEEGECPYCNP